MLNNGIDPTDAKQSITHYSCDDCRDKQRDPRHYIENVTGVASEDNGGKIHRDYLDNLW